ncbi:MAG: hypothetical protein JRH20_06870 [Deltaproteobacteria bacterium]|nr:hypothetical protein [Deltaproteobacteria bacterium]
MMGSLFSSTSKVRSLFDLAWVVAFIVVLGLLYGGGRGRVAFDGSIQLDLPIGEQLRRITLRGKRVGVIKHRVERHKKGWRITQRFFAEIAKERVEVAWSRLVLRKDLSLESLAVSADPERLTQLMGLSGGLARLLNVGKLKLHGSCRLQSGRCRLQGNLGGKRVNQSVMAGRGPVVPTALFPLLARGVLGNQAELVIFDPMSLTRKVVKYEITGREQIEVGGARFDALRVKQDVEGLPTTLWLDDRGRVLKEQLPMGLWVEHEAWR